MSIHNDKPLFTLAYQKDGIDFSLRPAPSIPEITKVEHIKARELGTIGRFFAKILEFFTRKTWIVIDGKGEGAQKSYLLKVNSALANSPLAKTLKKEEFVQTLKGANGINKLGNIFQEIILNKSNVQACDSLDEFLNKFDNLLSLQANERDEEAIQVDTALRFLENNKKYLDSENTIFRPKTADEIAQFLGKTSRINKKYDFIDESTDPLVNKIQKLSRDLKPSMNEVLIKRGGVETLKNLLSFLPKNDSNVWQFLNAREKTKWVGENPEVSLKSLGMNSFEKIMNFVKKTNNDLTSLNLQECKFSYEQITQLLTYCPNLNHLAIESDKISDAELFLLAAKMSELKGLKTLQLSLSDYITDQGLSDLAKAKLPIIALSLKECRQITDAGFKQLADSKLPLESLDLTRCYGITDQGVKDLIDSGMPLKHLNLYGLQVTDKSFETIATSNCRLESLDVSWNEKITSKALKYIADAKMPLQDLTLYQCRQIYIQEGIQYLIDAELPLKRLDLRSMWVQDDDLKLLADSKLPLETLYLQAALVTDLGVQYLSESKLPLKDLSLKYCKITDISLKYLAESKLPISSLDLTSCEKISDQGLHELAINKVPLKRLILDHCTISKEGIKELAESRPPLEFLSLDWCQNFYASDRSDYLQYLTDARLPLKNLKRPNDLNTLSKKEIQYLSKLPIETLDAKISYISEEGLQSLNALKHEVSPVFNHHIFNEDFKKIAQSTPRLKALKLHIYGGAEDFTNTSMKYLVDSGLPLVELNLRRCKITDDSLKYLADSKLQIVSLDLMECDITDEGLKYLAESKLPIEALDLRGCKITDEGLQYLAKLPLKNLTLDDCKELTDTGLKALVSQLKRPLKSLHFVGCDKIQTWRSYLNRATSVLYGNESYPESYWP